MQHFPIFLDLKGQRVVVSGAGETAVAKVRLLLKTEATVAIYGADPAARVRDWASAGQVRLTPRPLDHGDALCARLVYAANDDPAEDARAAEIGRAAGALVNIVDNLADSQFITPAIVDRDPVTVAIGTEGAAPVLARRIKAETEERLPQSIGALARIGRAHRKAAEMLPQGRVRRAFWARYYDDIGPQALAEGGEPAVHDAIAALLHQSMTDTATEGRVTQGGVTQGHVTQGRVTIVGTGPGDPDLLTMKARRALHEADVVVHDRLVPAAILELARREATIQEVGKTPYGPAWKQSDINSVMIGHAVDGAHVVRLKSGDPAVYGRLDEEMDALDAAAIPFDIIPGITTASAAAASIKTSLTRRHRNSSIRFLTGHDVDGFADQDWRSLATPGAVAAIYMGVRAARFLQGRLMIHGADPDTPVTVIENVSRPGQVTVAATLATLPDALTQASIKGPAIIFLGLTPRAAARVAPSAAETLEPNIAGALS